MGRTLRIVAVESVSTGGSCGMHSCFLIVFYSGLCSEAFGTGDRKPERIWSSASLTEGADSWNSQLKQSADVFKRGYRGVGSGHLRECQS